MRLSASFSSVVDKACSQLQMRAQVVIASYRHGSHMGGVSDKLS